MTIAELITKNESMKLYPYKDTVGKLTIGVGHNLTDNGISRQIAELMLKEDIAVATAALRDIFPSWANLPADVQFALTDMMFNMGEPRFLGFKKMIKAVKNKDFLEAAEQAKDSKWFKQVGVRGESDYNLLKRAGNGTIR